MEDFNNKLDELILYMKTKFSCEESNNDNLTKLILRENIIEAVYMICNNKDLKFNRDLMDCCDGNNTCNGYFESFIRRICSYNINYMIISKLLHFLTPENMISNEIFEDGGRRGLCDYNCCELIHFYT
jgi:hypothetical protein